MSESTVPRTRDPRPLHGLTACDASGAAIGRVAGVYSDVEFGLTEWAAVRIGRLGRHEVLVPLADALVVGGDLRLGYPRELVDAAPHRDPGRHLTVRMEQELFDHYSIPWAGETVTAADDDPDSEYDEASGEWYR